MAKHRAIDVTIRVPSTAQPNENSLGATFCGVQLLPSKQEIALVLGTDVAQDLARVAVKIAQRLPDEYTRQTLTLADVREKGWAAYKNRMLLAQVPDRFSLPVVACRYVADDIHTGCTCIIGAALNEAARKFVVNNDMNMGYNVDRLAGVAINVSKEDLPKLRDIQAAHDRWAAQKRPDLRDLFEREFLAALLR